MKEFRKIWNDETNGFLVACRDLSREDCYRVFMAKFPDSKVTFCALCNQLSRLHLRPHMKHGSARRSPLYSEQVKKGYVRIKVAEPNVWMQKNKWVYMETHPWEDCSERSNYVFLDGNNRNFSPDNIERVSLKVMGVFNLLGGCEKGQPEITRLRIAQAKLKLAIMDKGEKLGLVVTVDSKGRKRAGRLFIDERNRRAREYNARPERKKIIAQRAREYREKLKIENPEKYAEMRLKEKAYCKQWYERKKTTEAGK